MYALKVNIYEKFHHSMAGVVIDSPNIEIILVIDENGVVSQVHTRSFSNPFKAIATLHDIELSEAMQLLFNRLVIGVDRLTTIDEQIVYTAFIEHIRELFKKQEL